MRPIGLLSLAVVVAFAAPSTARAGVRLSIRDGRVSIVATDATAGEILAEWARVGQTKVVNIEVLPQERMTIELQDVSEEQALAVLLRHVSGYIAARRATEVADASRFDRLLIMPRSAAVAAAPVPVPDTNDTPPDDPSTDQTMDPASTIPDTAYQAASGEASAGQGSAGRARDRAADPAADYEAPGYRGTPNLASSVQTPAVQPPPPRPMASGQMAGRRTAVTAGQMTGSQTMPASRAPQRDRQVAPPQQVPGIDAADAANGEQIPPFVAVPVPAEDPVAQATFKTRRAVETVNPREFHFPLPQRVAAPPGAAAPVPGTVVPGVPVPPIKPPGGPGGR